MPKLSVIVPVFKTEDYIVRCINSILSQNYRNFELILVNDGSPDKCPKICDEYALKDPRIIVIHKKNGGVSSARNAGIKVAKGECIIFIDSDDYIADNMFDSFIKAIDEDKNIDFLVSGILMKTYKNGTEINNYEMMNKTYSKKEMLEALEIDYKLINISSPCAKLYRRDILEENSLLFEEDMDLGEDGYFNLCYLEKCNNIITLDSSYYIYTRAREDSLFSKYNKGALEANERFLNKLRELIIKNKCINSCRVNFERMYFNTLISCIIKDFQFSSQNDKYWRINNIKKVVNNPHINQNLNIYQLKGIKNNLIKKLISFKQCEIIYHLFRFYYRGYFKR